MDIKSICKQLLITDEPVYVTKAPYKGHVPEMLWVGNVEIFSAQAYDLDGEEIKPTHSWIKAKLWVSTMVTFYSTGNSNVYRALYIRK